MLRVVAIAVLFVWLFVDFIVVFSRRPKDAKQSARFSMLGVIVSVWVGIYLAIAQLGAFHTPQIAVQAGHRVVDTGLYRHVRHPSHLSATIALFGFGLGLASIPSALAVVSCAAYCRRTYRLIPGLY